MVLREERSATTNNVSRCAPGKTAMTTRSAPTAGLWGLISGTLQNCAVAQPLNVAHEWVHVDVLHGVRARRFLARNQTAEFRARVA
jgi:hypothetical protein